MKLLGTMFLASFAVHFHLIKIQGMEQSTRSKSPNGGFSVGDFHFNQHRYLAVTKVTSAMVADSFDCTFLCVAESNCSAFNIAVNPDSNGLYLCELLPNDKYRATDKLHANTSFHHYSLWTPCEQDPCRFGSTCVPNFETNLYECICEEGTTGDHCECAGNKTCSHIKLCHPMATNGHYLIDPDGDGSLTPFTVYCDMSDKHGVGVTVISHDTEERTLVDGYEDPGKYSRDIHYIGANFDQLASLSNQSTYCEQFIKYECSHSRLFYNNNPMFAWWVSRDNLNMTSWGGVTLGDFKCACGVNNTCADSYYGCNCDKNDKTWREDSGLLTNKSHLPVRQLRFGDTGASNEQGKHTLGKLKCRGVTDL